ncbi:hypothetical protein BKA67DRAFT_586711 [Truncatella angustata]|uniref:Uncharacterized protein n=1 Tax=Truncatella angustata TaxID=152316 RepID=A0A9P8RFE4_9PEZI|nr:uncharacterized protein BKA67DRAFT_586711 [Truncatella angustata]KAH6645003.1 hypothetical protein BKA67DRAFT_586711 [Truncatella angustata]
MLKAFERIPLQSSRGGSEGGDFVCVEAWHDPNDGTPSFSKRRLETIELEDWAWQRGQFTPDLSYVNSTNEGARLRILFAQSKSPFRPIVPSVLVSDKILEALQLPRCSFASYQQPSGVFSSHTYPEGCSVEQCSRLSLVLRTPQKWEMSTGGLIVTHDFESGMTTALSIGLAFELDKCASADGSLQPSPALGAFFDQIEECEHLWGSPLLLPSLFLVAHVQRVRTYIMEDLSRRIVAIEQIVGVTNAGQSQRRYYEPRTHPAYRDDQKLFVGEHLQRDHAKKLTQTINNLSTWIIFTKRSPYWDIEAVKFIRGILDGSERLRNYRNISAQAFRETLDYVQNYSEASLEVTQTSEERMKLQLNILYTAVAQDDGQTSARLAASAGKDSTSMKIIALITAAYLPGTFVATLFSMGMFDWRGSSSDSGDGAPMSFVSPNFWIYWTVAIPLTILTLIGWATWWRIEERRFVRDIQQAVQDKPSSQSGNGTLEVD